MGQYKQWLHYREIDQLLRSQLAVSEHELEQLQAQVEILGKQNFFPENAIFQALIKPQQGEWSPREESDRQYEEEFTEVTGRQGRQGRQEEEIEQVEEIVIEEVEEEDTATISPALLAWSRLPNFDTELIEEHEVNSLPRPPEPPPAQPSEQLLPVDISAFIDAHYPTNPQINIPWWLRASSDQQETHASDQQSERADYLVQRWFERWGQQSMKTKRSQEDQKQ